MYKSYLKSIKNFKVCTAQQWTTKNSSKSAEEYNLKTL